MGCYVILSNIFIIYYEDVYPLFNQEPTKKTGPVIRYVVHIVVLIVVLILYSMIVNFHGNQTFVDFVRFLICDNL